MIREFIKEDVEEYNSGRLTPQKLYDMKRDYEITSSTEHDNKRRNLHNATKMLDDLFTKQKGRTVLEKVCFEWEEVAKRPNPYYGD